jgi:hypothetical protein
LYAGRGHDERVEPLLSITRAWRLVKFVDSGMLCLTKCTRCGGHFINHAYELTGSYVCGLCEPPARAGKGRRGGLDPLIGRALRSSRQRGLQAIGAGPVHAGSDPGRRTKAGETPPFLLSEASTACATYTSRQTVPSEGSSSVNRQGRKMAREVFHSGQPPYMFVIIGYVVVLGAVFGGYALAGGKFGVIIKAAPIELFIICGRRPARSSSATAPRASRPP